MHIETATGKGQHQAYTPEQQQIGAMSRHTHSYSSTLRSDSRSFVPADGTEGACLLVCCCMRPVACCAARRVDPCLGVTARLGVTAAAAVDWPPLPCLPLGAGDRSI